MAECCLRVAVGHVTNVDRKTGRRILDQWHKRKGRDRSHVPIDCVKRTYKVVGGDTVVENRGFCGGIRRDR